MTRYLLDVNVLLALVDPFHLHHHPAHHWYSTRSPLKLVLCPFVTNGVMRISSQPKYPNPFPTASAVRDALKRFEKAVAADFCTREASLLDDEALVKAELLTSARVSDLYLLALAVANEARLATFDRRIPAEAIAGGPAALEIIPMMVD